MSAKVGVSGANFAVAETGTICILESEGNGRMCTTLPEVLITVMGIEKVLPRFADLEVMLQLLPRSSTAERMNPYTSLWTGVTADDGPREFHLVLLDAGRTNVLGDADGRAALHCIRCSACLNVCPVYERTGGHAYESTYPGPIGAILTPQLTGFTQGNSLPWASSLCGACYEVCPVKIDIPSILIHLRSRINREVDGYGGGGEALAMGLLARAFARPGRYERVQRLGRWLSRPLTLTAGSAVASRERSGVGRCPRPAGAVGRDLSRMVGTAPMSSRELILGRVRAALADVPDDEPTSWIYDRDADEQSRYTRAGNRDREALVTLSRTAAASTAQRHANRAGRVGGPRSPPRARATARALWSSRPTSRRLGERQGSNGARITARSTCMRSASSTAR